MSSVKKSLTERLYASYKDSEPIQSALAAINGEENNTQLIAVGGASPDTDLWAIYEDPDRYLAAVSIIVSARLNPGDERYTPRLSHYVQNYTMLPNAKNKTLKAFHYLYARAMQPEFEWQSAIRETLGESLVDNGADETMRFASASLLANKQHFIGGFAVFRTIHNDGLASGLVVSKDFDNEIALSVRETYLDIPGLADIVGEEGYTKHVTMSQVCTIPTRLAVLAKMPKTQQMAVNLGL